MCVTHTHVQVNCPRVLGLQIADRITIIFTRSLFEGVKDFTGEKDAEKNAENGPENIRLSTYLASEVLELC